MTDFDLASIYGVTTRRLNEQVRRNARRFPADFMFQLTPDEHRALMSQIATSKKGRGGRHKLTFVFTQEGTAMLSSVLKSERAIEANIAIMRAFVHSRGMVSLSRELSEKLRELESKVGIHDEDIRNIFSAIRRLSDPPPVPRRRIGFDV